MNRCMPKPCARLDVKRIVRVAVLRNVVVRSALACLFAGCLMSGAGGQEKPLIAGVDDTFAPHVMPRLSPGVEGFNVDLINEIARLIGRRIDLAVAEFSALIPAMQAGRIDFVGAPTTVTAERARNMLFTEPYLNTYHQFLVSAGKPDLSSFADLKGKVIAASKGSAFERWLADHAARYGFRAESYPTHPDAVQAVLSGRADATLSGHTVAAHAALRNRGKLRLSTLVIDEGLVWAAPFRKGDAALRDLVDAAIECLKTNGTIARLHLKWLGSRPAPGSAALTVYPGRGVPGMPGYDASPQTPQCK
jgi:polar amino acid transport system substrate-binding protein